MKNKKLVLERLNLLKIESGQSDKDFKNTLASITGKTPRTVRRWYSLENNIHDADIDSIAKYFGKHSHWLRYGDRRRATGTVDQIMSSDYFGVVILKDNLVEDVNFKLLEMMALPDTDNQPNILHHLLQQQSEQTLQLYKSNHEQAINDGTHVTQMSMLLGDDKQHLIEVTTLNLNNNRVLKILFDKGLVSPASAHQLPPKITSLKSKTERGLTILFVDDEIASCKLFNTILSIHNCQLTTYTDSLLALNDFRQNYHSYDLLITDIIMPEMTGDELAAECRKIKPQLPVILFSGYASHLNKTSAEEFGVSYYLQKPVNSAELLSILASLRPTPVLS